MTYEEMEKKFGKIMAQDILMTIEKMARVNLGETVTMNEEERLQHAYNELDRLDAERQARLSEEQKAVERAALQKRRERRRKKREQDK